MIASVISAGAPLSAARELIIRFVPAFICHPGKPQGRDKRERHWAQPYATIWNFAPFPTLSIGRPALGKCLPAFRQSFAVGTFKRDWRRRHRCNSHRRIANWRSRLHGTFIAYGGLSH